MKKFLPFLKNSKGFTLIELLTVVAIIAILAVIALAIFTSTQKNARDGRRRGDVDALHKTLEVNRALGKYIFPFSGSWFAGGNLPAIDPQAYPYCIKYDAAAVPADPATWTTSCPATWAQVTTSGAVAIWDYFKVCSVLELPIPGVFCRSNAQ